MNTSNDLADIRRISEPDVRPACPLIAMAAEAPVRLAVNPPRAESLSRELVFIQYRVENMRVLPVFGRSAMDSTSQPVPLQPRDEVS